MTDLLDDDLPDDPPDREDLFSGYATPFERALAKVDGRLDDLDMDRIRRARSLDEAEPAFLPYQASEKSVDVYDPAWPIEIRREVIRVAPLVHAIKGTPVAIQTALGALRVSTEIVEWWESAPRGTPYTFSVTAFVRTRLYADGPPLDARTVRAVFATVMRTKAHARAFDLHVGVGLGTGLGLAPAAVARGRVAAQAPAMLPVPEARCDLGLAPAALARQRAAAAAVSALPIPPARSDLAVTAAAVARVRVCVTANLV